MSDRAIAEMCAVSHTLVENMRRALSPSIGNECQYRATSDGRQYPAERKTPGKVVTKDGKVKLPMAERAIAEMCAVGDQMVATMRRTLDPGAGIMHLPTRTGRDGKEYPAAPTGAL